MREWTTFMIFFSLVFFANAWDQSDLEMFDLMEELNVNFYEFFNVPTTASPLDIKRAYRKLSLELHPDKNKEDPDAGVKFRQLSIIYQILKDDERRERYDDALENGIPDWKTPVFYYRKLRKMSNYEIGALVSVVFITIHFATLWGLAYERRWTLRERLEGHMKRHKASDKRKKAIDLEIAEQLKVIKYPSLMDILPVALLRAFINLIRSIPVVISLLRGTVRENIQKVKKDFDEKRELAKEQQERAKRKEEQKKKRKQLSGKYNFNEESDYFDNPFLYQVANLVARNEEFATETEDAPSETKPWTQNEELALIRLTNKYPGGFPNRWSKIAQTLGRSVVDVTAKASEIANEMSSRSLVNPAIDEFYEENTSDVGQKSEESEENDYYLSKRKAKRSGKVEKGHFAAEKKEEVPESKTILNGSEVTAFDENEDGDVHVSRRKQKALVKATAEKETIAPAADGWTQKEQNQLEIAMNSFPKGTPKRWQLIAECVPSKTSTQVMNRVKFLAEHSKMKL